MIDEGSPSGGQIGPQVVERVADLADDGADVDAEMLEPTNGVGIRHVTHQAVELEREVAERLADPIVEFAGDADALLVGAERAETGEESGVVDREGEGVDETANHFDVAGPRTGRGVVFERHDADEVPSSAKRRVTPSTDASCRPVRSRVTASARSVSAAWASTTGSVCSSYGPSALTPLARTTSQWRTVSSKRTIAPRSKWMRSWARVIASSTTDARSSRRGQLLGHALQRREQLVGFAQLCDPVGGERAVLGGLDGNGPHDSRQQGHHDEARTTTGWRRGCSRRRRQRSRR